MVNRKVWAAVMVLVCAVATSAAGPRLVRVERQGTSDREKLIRAGVTLVHEFEGGFFALEEPGKDSLALEAMGYRRDLLETDTSGWQYYILGLREGAGMADVLPCGDVVWAEENWVLVRAPGEFSVSCLESAKWFVAPLTLEPLALPKPAPPEYAHLQGEPEPQAVTVNPLVQDLVNAMTPTVATANWDAVITSATNRNSTSAGCTTATTAVYNKFSGLSLSPAYQTHTSGYAPNVIGTLTGKVNPTKQYIGIGHIDDAPATGAAPGADDNASGTAMVTAAAQLMSGYCYANTLKFVVVTGEEQGLYGSNYYANTAHTAGDDIQAVLNGDMIAWTGDGLPATGENLDLNYNATSQWLGTLFADCATAYSTGCVVDAFSCPSLTASDHARFWYWGYSAVCGITDNEGYCSHAGEYAYYHTSNDTKANCGDLTFFYGAMKAYVAALAHLADPLCVAPFPNAPTAPSASANGANHIQVSWTGGAGTGPSYEVYRAPGGCSGSLAYTKVGETTGTSFDDATASGGITYAYTVKSKKTRCVSAGTTCVSASTTGPCLEAPTFAGVTGVANPAAGNCALNVSWGAATAWCGGPLAYNIYRDVTPSFTPSVANRVAAGVSGTSYSDGSGLVSGTTYYYIVRAVDQTSLSEDANTLALSGKPTGPLSDGTWTAGAESGDPAMTLESPWAASATYKKSGSYSYSTNVGTSYPSSTCASLTTPALILGAGSTLAYSTIWSLETGYDYARVEISQDGGTSWTVLTPSPAYGSTITYSGNACAWATASAAYGGNSTTYPTNWIAATVSLSSYAGRTVLLRWRFSTDSGVAGSGSNPGWYVDDISITHVQVPGTCTTVSVPGETAGGGTISTAQSWSSKTNHTWSANAQATSYKVYRGTQADLPQLLNSSTDSCLKWSGSATNCTIGDDPSAVAGGFYWYLVTGINGSGEGTAGNATAGPRVVNSSGACP